MMQYYFQKEDQLICLQ